MKTMLNKNFYKKALLTALTMASAISYAPVGNAALASYSQNFEELNHQSPSALGNDGWLISSNVPAPNNGPGFSTITVSNGGAAQGAQQLLVFSDYMNLDHAAGKWVETLVYQEQTISVVDVGSIWNFTFDTKQGNQMPSSSSYAFLKTLNNILTFNTTDFGHDWGTQTLSMEIDNSMDGQLLQFGFSTTATSYIPSGVLYDNISLSKTPAVPVPAALWLFGSGLLGLIGVARRRKS